eukprot:1324029-Amorphochlora_amoeboformis.AAC.2
MVEKCSFSIWFGEGCGVGMCVAGCEAARAGIDRGRSGFGKEVQRIDQVHIRPKLEIRSCKCPPSPQLNYQEIDASPNSSPELLHRENPA